VGVAVGVDFGTSNSAVAMPGERAGDPARVLPIDLAGEDGRLFRSVMFFPEDSRDVLGGGAAIRRYLAEGEGRFLQSIKSFLHSRSFHATEVRRRSFKLEELVAALLRMIRVEAERVGGGPVTRAVFGRPAAFSPEPELDALAERRLAAAAELAGFPTPTFLIEPIAAALHYEEQLARDELVLVGDFGAGTSDFTLMRLGPSFRGREDRRADVVASSGVRVGGDRFDAAIVEHRLLARFGHGSTYGSMLKRLDVPTWMTRKLLAWHELALLRERSTLAFLAEAVESSDRPRDLENLVTLVESNLAYHLYRAVEAAKRALSEDERAVVSFHEADIDLEVPVTRAEFETWTAPLRDELTEALERCLAQAGGLMPDAVFLTGGSSRIPSVRRLFTDRFGPGRVREGDSFTSVAAGLGRAAGIASIGGQPRWDAAR
jgi:hypothetical chaperone protein